jgi:hypothetical protein
MSRADHSRTLTSPSFCNGGASLIKKALLFGGLPAGGMFGAELVKAMILIILSLVAGLFARYPFAAARSP